MTDCKEKINIVRKVLAGFCPLAILLSLLLIGCSSDPEATVASSTAATVTEVPVNFDSDEETAAAPTETVKGIDVSTPIGELEYPLGDYENVTMEESSENGLSVVRFLSEVQGEKVLLFEILFGAGGSGYNIGAVPDKDGTLQEVWLNIEEIEPRDNWSEEETAEVNRQQELVNDLLDQIYSLPGYIRNE